MNSPLKKISFFLKIKVKNCTYPCYNGYNSFIYILEIWIIMNKFFLK